jgi:hypothetical protein
MSEESSLDQLAAAALASQEEEQRCRKVWIEHVNALYVPEGEEEVVDETAYITARYILQGHKQGRLLDAHEDTPKLAQALLDAGQRSRDTFDILTAEYAISYPEHLDELNDP